MGEEGAFLLPGGVSALGAEASLGAEEGREREATLGAEEGPFYSTAHRSAAPGRLSSNIHVGPIQRVGPLAGMIGSLLSRWTTQVETRGLRERISFRKTDPT